MVVDDITSWSMMSNPLAGLAEYIEFGSEIGLHVHRHRRHPQLDAAGAGAGNTGPHRRRAGTGADP